MVRQTRKRGGSNKNKKPLLSPGPLPKGEEWGTFLLNENKKEEYKKKGKDNKKAGKNARNRTRRNYLEKHCADVLEERIDGVTVRDALKGCEIPGCKNWHIGEAKKKGQEECVHSALKTKALGVLKEKCPDYLKRGGSIRENACDSTINYIIRSELTPTQKHTLMQNIANELLMGKLDLNRMLNGIPMSDNFKRGITAFYDTILKEEESLQKCSDKIGYYYVDR